MLFSPRNCFPQFLDQEKHLQKSYPFIRNRGRGVELLSITKNFRYQIWRNPEPYYFWAIFFCGGGWVFPYIGLTHPYDLAVSDFEPPSHIPPEENRGSCCWPNVFPSLWIPHLFVVATEQLHLVRCESYWIFSQFQVSDFKGAIFGKPKRKSRKTVWPKEF